MILTVLLLLLLLLLLFTVLEFSLGGSMYIVTPIYAQLHVL